ncbi:MAG: hypothetical protein ACI8RD_014947 [Bacillariaceae sp.]|jgi:hypothetical protein
MMFIYATQSLTQKNAFSCFLNIPIAVSFVTPAVEGHMDLIEKRHLETPPEREILPGFEPNEERWTVEAAGTKISVPGVEHSSKGLVHDKMFGGKSCKYSQLHAVISN